MTSRAAREGISVLAGSVGCLIDRCLKRQPTLGAVFLVDGDKVVTCAHLVVLYSSCLEALKVTLPVSGQEYGIAGVRFHPRLNLKLAERMARQALAEPVPALSLQEHNLAVLTLGGAPAALSDEAIAGINDQLASPAPPRDKGLGGSLADLDLPLVVQTITNARKEGVLVLSDERNRPIARLFCRDGKVLHALYGPLEDEKAIYQIVSQHPGGNFYFASRKEPDWPVGAPINRPTDMLLIEAHRRLDEIPGLLLDLGGDTATYRRARETADLQALPQELRADAERLWPLLDGRHAAGQLWSLSELDDYGVFQALAGLLKHGQICEVEVNGGASGASPAPLVLAPELPLAPFDDIESLAVDPVCGAPVVNCGHLLGSLRPGDPWHLLHNLGLPEEAAGSPIFKNGQVVGIHCGRLPADPSLAQASTNISQLLWIESVFECLEPGLEQGARAPEPIKRLVPTGCTEVACIDCPRCGASSLGSSRFCKSCGQQLIQDITYRSPLAVPWKPVAFVAAALAVLAIVGGGIAYVAASWRPPRAPLVVRSAARARLLPEILKADRKSARWVPVPPGSMLHNGDLICLSMKVRKDSFVYVLHQGTTPTDINLIFPASQEDDILYPKDVTVTVPRENMGKSPAGTLAMSGMTVTGKPGSEALIFLASDVPSALYTSSEGDAVLKTYELAAKMLRNFDSPAGVEVPASAFGDDIFAGAAKSGTGNVVYVTRLEILHRD